MMAGPSLALCIWDILESPPTEFKAPAAACSGFLRGLLASWEAMVEVNTVSASTMGVRWNEHVKRDRERERARAGDAGL